MSVSLTAEERAELRAEHSGSGQYHRYDDNAVLCDCCERVWPCATIKALDALEAAEARERTLREALEFYALPANWRRENLGGGWVAEPLMDSDNGVRAQVALAATAPQGAQ